MSLSSGWPLMLTTLGGFLLICWYGWRRSKRIRIQGELKLAAAAARAERRQARAGV